MSNSHKVRRIREHYSKRVHPDRPSHEILDWGDPEAQHIRFDVLAQIVQFHFGEEARDGAQSSETPGRSLSGMPPLLLDIGCGMADLAASLKKNSCPVRYVGCDITPRILKEAGRRSPASPLVCADVFGDSPFPVKTFDVTYCSGVFNLRLGNNREFVKKALKGMAALSKTLSVANFLHARTRKKYPHCFYFDPEEIREFLETIPGHVDILDDYLENDFTVVLRMD